MFIQESSSDGNPLNLHDLEFDDYTVGMALSSPLFTQEREDVASRRQDFYSLDEGLSSSQSSAVDHVGTGRPVIGSLIPNVRETPRRDFENEQIRTLLERQKEQILADYQAQIQKHEFQADYDRSIQKLNRELRGAHEKGLNEMEELKRLQGSTFDTISRRRSIEDRDTILELTGKTQELQNEIV